MFSVCLKCSVSFSTGRITVGAGRASIGGRGFRVNGGAGRVVAKRWVTRVGSAEISTRHSRVTHGSHADSDRWGARVNDRGRPTRSAAL
ncbi:hypothetical protein QQF64_026342 [Cirrhinus molitorella]|uniref:Uncharacterized protein n=1 Tax=Cirrhinus molitorella TaxID=172907 RepID=A0ABR3N9A2_9TELE